MRLCTGMHGALGRSSAECNKARAGLDTGAVFAYYAHFIQSYGEI